MTYTLLIIKIRKNDFRVDLEYIIDRPKETYEFIENI